MPGALVKLLAVFARRKINLSRFELRPSKRSLEDYVFCIDIQANVYKSSVKSALEELVSYTETLKVIGSYTVLQV